MLPSPCVTDAFREILHRDPGQSELQSYSAASRDRTWLKSQLRESEEHRSVVGPLRKRLLREWQTWQFRQPTNAELKLCIDGTRHKCGGDDGVRGALADGSIETRLDFRPITMEMDITNQCNLRCVMCLFSQPSLYQQPRQHLPLEKFQEIAAQAFARTDVLSLSFGAEPLLNKNVPEMLATIARYRVRHAYMNTNGLLLREPIMAAMIDHGFHSLLVSIDAATKKMYESIRIGGVFEKLMANLRALQEMKSKRGVRHPRLRLAFVIMRKNMHELPAFVDLAADIGAVSVNAMHMMAWENVGNVTMAAVHEKSRCNQYLAAARERAQARKIDFVAPEPFRTHADNRVLVEDMAERSAAFGINLVGTPKNTCPFPWSFAAIDMRGNVVPCGWWHAEKAMGNIHEQDFLSIWRGAEYQQLRSRHLQQKLTGSCASCSASGMGSPDAEHAFSPR